MIFTRRAIQRCLDELRVLSREDLEGLVLKLNEPDAARLPAMWEVIILHALSGLGRVAYEVPQASGRRPDITFRGSGVAFTADVTCVSDAGLDAVNPVEELSDAIEACKARLGLPVGGMSLKVEGERSRTKRGERTSLLLPPRGKIEQFVRKQIEPSFREQLASGATVLEFSVDQPGVRFSVRVAGERFNNTSYPSYNAPGSLTLNPLYNALSNKAKQLRGIEGRKGVIVCDGDCASLQPSSPLRSRFTDRQILEEFLRQNSSIHFALAVTVKEDQTSWMRGPSKPYLVATLVVQSGLSEAASLDTLFRQMIERMPQPKDTPVNAALRAREPGFGWGKHGGYSMSRSSLKMSSRLLVEVLAGRRSIKELHKFHRWRFPSDPQDNNTMVNPFARWLSEGKLPVSIVVEADPEGTDDWVEFKFGEPDPAVSVFRVPEQPAGLRRVWQRACHLVRGWWMRSR
jgi:hypothetical protein